MKYINILVSLMLFCSIYAKAESDKLFFDCEPLTPGGDYVEVTVGLEGSRKYIGFQVEITAPEGLAFAKDEDGDYCYTLTKKQGICANSHMITGELTEDEKTLKVSCISLSAAELTATSGSLFVFYLKATPYAKPGDVTLSYANTKFAVPGQTYVTFDPATTDAITVTNNATANINISNDVKWSTCILPFDVAEIPAGFKAYACNSTKESSLVLSPVSTMAAYTPYILYSESGCNVTLTGTVDASAYPADGTATAGYITGTVAQTTVSNGYVLQKQDGEVKFYMIGSSTPISVPAGKCWVNVPSSLAKASFGITFGSPTGINDVQNDGNASAACYSVAGIKVVQPQEGQIYIVNGKKHIAE